MKTCNGCIYANEGKELTKAWTPCTLSPTGMVNHNTVACPDYEKKKEKGD